MIHRAICGSIERFIGILLENHAGHLPLWLARSRSSSARSPQEGDDYAMELVARARKKGLRVEADLRNEKISYKVREHSLAKVPALLAIGKNEAAERTVSIRRLGSNAQETKTLDEALAAFVVEATPPDLARE